MKSRASRVSKRYHSPYFFLFSVLHLYYFFVLIVPFVLTVQHT